VNEEAHDMKTAARELPTTPARLAVYADHSAVDDVVPATHPLEVVRDPDTHTAHPATATATEPPARDREPADVPDELVEAAREELAIPSDETDEG
jgi:hypothetical protein